MKIHIPEQSFEIDAEGYGRIKFDLCTECAAPADVAPEAPVVESVTTSEEAPEAAPQPEEAVVEAPVSAEVAG